jgi:hypothetical protein
MVHQLAGILKAGEIERPLGHRFADSVLQTLEAIGFLSDPLK